MKYIFLNFILAIGIFGYFFILPESKSDEQSVDIKQTSTRVKIVAQNLNVPWEIAWGPDNKIWIAEQQGLISRIDPISGKKEVLLKLTDVWQLRTSGLLGMALHSDMKKDPYVFLDYTIEKDKKRYSRLVRYTWDKDTLLNAKVLMEIPAAVGHNGSRIVVNKGLVYWATGDAYTRDFTYMDREGRLFDYETCKNEANEYYKSKNII